MPIYEYDCPNCGRFEVIQKISAKPLKECPKCKEAGKDAKITRAVSAAAFHLKGSGWYKTDYGSNGPSSSSKTSSSSSSDTSKTTKNETGDSSKGSEKKNASGKPGACGSTCGCH